MKMRTPVPEEIQKIGQFLARYIDQELSLENSEQEYGFALFISPFGSYSEEQKGWCFYVSNINRSDTLKLVKTFVAAEEGH